MKATQYFILFLILAAAVVIPAAFHLHFSPRTDVQFHQFTMTFDGMNATGEIEYNVGFLTDLYVFFFGSRNLEPYINNFLYNFDEYRIVSFHGNSVTVEFTNSSRFVDQYYLHDSRPFGNQVNWLVLIYPDGETRIYENVSATPNTFY
jgi:hypothetical protein